MVVMTLGTTTELTFVNEKIDRDFFEIFGEEWKIPREFHLQSEESTGSHIHEILEKIKENFYVEAKERMVLWFFIEKSDATLFDNIALLFFYLWEKAVFYKEKLLVFFLSRKLVDLLQHNSDALLSHSDLLFLECSLKFIHQNKIDSVSREAKFLQALVGKQIFQEKKEEDTFLSTNLYALCLEKKPFLTPQELLRNFNYKEYGNLVKGVLSLCYQRILKEEWKTWDLVDWVFLAFKEEGENAFYAFLNTLLEEVPDSVLAKQKDHFVDFLKSSFGHPLSSVSEWRFFSQKSKSRVLSWSGNVQYKEYYRIHDALSSIGYYRYLSQIRSDSYGEGVRANNRYKFWSKYSRYMKFVRFFLTSSAYEWLEKGDGGRLVVKETGVGRFYGEGNSISDLCVMEFEPFVVIEFFYGAMNDALFIDRSHYENNASLFLENSIYSTSLRAIPFLKKQGHPYLWQLACERFLYGHQIFPASEL